MKQRIALICRVAGKSAFLVIGVIACLAIGAFLFSRSLAASIVNITLLLAIVSIALLVVTITLFSISQKKGPWSLLSEKPARRPRLRQVLFWEYKALSLVFAVFGAGILILETRDPHLYVVLGPFIIADIVLLFLVTLAHTVWRGGPRAIVRILRSTRFHLTLWFIALLALIFIALDGTIYVTEQYSLVATLDTYLHTLLSQVVAYNAQTKRLAFVTDAHLITSFDGSQQRDSEVAVLIPLLGDVQTSRDLAEPDRTRLLLQVEAEERDLGYPDMQRVMARADTNFRPSTTNAAGDQMTVYDVRHFPITMGGVPYEFRVAVIVDQRQQAIALLAVGLPDTSAAELRQLSLTLGMATPLILLLSSAAGYWLAGRAMRPVQAITRTVRQMSETDLHRRLKLRQRDEIGELGATFDHLLDRLEAAFERQRQFTADASHELRTPLAIIDLEATRALAHDQTPQEYRRAITIMQNENRHMTRLVGDLLILARADSTQANFQREEIDLSEVVVDTVERLASFTQQTGLDLRIAALPELTVRGDRAYLMQMLTNIVENALKYSSGVGKHVDIVLAQRSLRGQEWAVLSIRDDGPGIAEEHLAHLFERFYRVDRSRTHSQALTPPFVTAVEPDSSPGTGKRPMSAPGGNGLGLAIAQWIARAHGGEITVQSIVGLGTIFEIELPLPSRPC